MSASLFSGMTLILAALADVLLIALVLALVRTARQLRRFADAAEERNQGFVEREERLIEAMSGTFDMTAELEALARSASRGNGGS